MATVFFVRHGVTDWNKEGRIQGNLSIRLNHEGQQQIRTLLPVIEKMKPDAIFCSPIKRAHESAEILTGHPGLNIVHEPGLAEVDVGDWLGKTVYKLRRTDRSWHENRNNPLITPPNGENIFDVQKRVVKVVEKIILAGCSRPIFVSHGDVIKAALCYFLKIPPERLRTIRVEPGSLSVPGTPKLKSRNEWNDVWCLHAVSPII